MVQSSDLTFPCKVKLIQDKEVSEDIYVHLQHKMFKKN
jgi:hypothetical protein